MQVITVRDIWCLFITISHDGRLLMDYPFVKQTGEDYGSHVASIIQCQQSRRQITANTIRILLLEEQNSELRHEAIVEAKEIKETNSGSDISKV